MTFSLKLLVLKFSNHSWRKSNFLTISPLHRIYIIECPGFFDCIYIFLTVVYGSNKRVLNSLCWRQSSNTRTQNLKSVFKSRVGDIKRPECFSLFSLNTLQWQMKMENYKRKRSNHHFFQECEKPFPFQFHFQGWLKLKQLVKITVIHSRLQRWLFMNKNVVIFICSLNGTKLCEVHRASF